MTVYDPNAAPGRSLGCRAPPARGGAHAALCLSVSQLGSPPLRWDGAAMADSTSLVLNEPEAATGVIALAGFLAGYGGRTPARLRPPAVLRLVRRALPTPWATPKKAKPLAIT